MSTTEKAVKAARISAAWAAVSIVLAIIAVVVTLSVRPPSAESKAFVGGTTVDADTFLLTNTMTVQTKQGSDPSAPAAGGVVIYQKDAAGKGTLCARFPTGAVQCFATEP